MQTIQRHCLALSITLAACDSPPSETSHSTKGSPSPCEGLKEQVACATLEGEPGAPQSLVLDFAGSGNYCAEVRQGDETPDRATALWLTLDGEQTLLSPASVNQNVDVVSTVFSAGPGAHQMELERAGTKKGSTDLCLYRVPSPEAVIAISPAASGHYSDPETGFELEWPEGAVLGDTQIWCEATDEGVIACGPDGTTFEEPLIVSFPYEKNEDLMVEGLAPVIKRDDETLLTTRIPARGRVYASTDHFTDFKVVYDIPAKISDHFAFFDSKGGDVKVPYLGVAKPLGKDEFGIIAFTKEVGHRYTITTSSPPSSGVFDLDCPNVTFPAGNVDVYGSWIDPEAYPSLVLNGNIRDLAKANGWSSENVPGMVEVEFNNAFNKDCARGTEDAFSVGSVREGEKSFYVLVDGKWNQDNYHTVRIVDVDMFKYPDNLEGKLSWPLDEYFKPTAYGQFNTTWGNAVYHPYYFGSGYEIAGGSPAYEIHDGVDVYALAGTEVKAICSGKVVRENSLGDKHQGFDWGHYIVQRCDIPGVTGPIHVAYNHINVAGLEAGDPLEEDQKVGTIINLELPGEPDHLHLGICHGEYDGTATQCMPHFGASRDKWFPYGGEAKKEQQLYPHINPDICTKERFCAEIKTPEQEALCQKPTIWKPVEGLNCN